MKPSLVWVACLVVTAALIERMSEGGLEMPPFPYSILNLFLFLLIILAVYVWSPLAPVKQWLLKPVTSLVAITCFLGIIIVGGFFYQLPPPSQSEWSKWGVFHMTQSWPFTTMVFLLMAILFLVVLNRWQDRSPRIIAINICHAGLFVIFAAMAFGSGDFTRAKMTVYQSHATHRAFSEKGAWIETPFSLKLNQFFLEEYPPKIVLATHDMKPVGRVFPEIRLGGVYTVKEWEIAVQEYVQYGIPQLDSYVSSMQEGAHPAAYVRITSKENTASVEGWIASGSSRFSPKSLDLGLYRLILSLPEPKQFLTKLFFQTDHGRVSGEADVKVNQPLKLKGWMIYQFDYDHDKKAWSQSNELELIRDPWQSIVYTGIGLLVIGGIMALLLTRFSRKGAQI